MISKLITAFLSSFLIVLILTPIFKKLALKLNVVDYPNERKIHKKPVPLFGGIPVFISITLLTFIFVKPSRELMGILIGSVIAFIDGLLDDVMELRASFRIFPQILAATICIFFGVRMTFLPHNIWGTALEFILSYLWLIGLTNAMNFFDGMDGLASSLSAVICFFLAVIGFLTNQFTLVIVSVIVMGATLSFLIYNHHPAKIFLGDAGSEFLGFFISALAMNAEWAEKGPLFALAIPVLIFGVMIFDMIYISIKRFVKKEVRTIREWLEYTGKDHLHHRLFNLGFSQPQTVFFIVAVTICLGVSGIILRLTFSKTNAILLVLQACIILSCLSVLMIKKQNV